MRHALVSIVLLSAVAAAPLAAQTQTIDVRVNKLEKEMKAVQRKIFPGGAQVQPDIDPAATTEAPAAPATTPISDLSARVDALESQLSTLTGQVESDGNRLRKLEEAVKALDANTNKRLSVLEPASGPAIVEWPAPTSVDNIPATSPATRPVPVPVVARANPQLTSSTAPAKPAQAAAVAPSTVSAAKRKAMVDAIEVPATGDAVEDAYSYAFRLWQASFYPEAQAKLKEFLAKNPRHRRTSYAQNLLGRAYLDEGKPALASVAFYENYTKNAKGERAAESLYYLGVALTRLKKLPDACKVYEEFREVYSNSASEDLKNRVTKARTDAKCS